MDEGAMTTSALLSDAHKRWYKLLHSISTNVLIHTEVQANGVSADSSNSVNIPVHWKNSLLDISSRKKLFGVTLVKSFFGVTLLNLTPDSPLQFLSSVLRGAILMEVNGVTVLLETFESITKTLSRVKTSGVRMPGWTIVGCHVVPVLTPLCCVSFMLTVLMRFQLRSSVVFDLLLPPPLALSGES